MSKAGFLIWGSRCWLCFGVRVMPIYEYVCDSCGFEKDILQKMSDEPLKDCPACQAPQFRKRISAAGFRLAGGGWYETDFKTGTKKNLAEKGGGASAKTTSDAAAG